MLGRLARRLGFQPSIPVALVEGWDIPEISRPPIELAPRDGVAACLVDEFGRIQPKHASWSLDFVLGAGARWMPSASSDRIEQSVEDPAVIETRYRTPSGPITQRVAAGIVDGKPVAVVEIENTGHVAIAVAAVLRPLRLDGRGYVATCEVAAGEDPGLSIDDHRVVRFESAPGSVGVGDARSGDLLGRVPDVTDTARSATTTCRSGGAQAAAVWPLPHTATLRIVVELDSRTDRSAPVPSTADINRGWATHLGSGMRIEVDGSDIGDRLARATRELLTLWPHADDAPTAISALAEIGFGTDAGRFLHLLERCDDDAAVIRSMARWAQLGVLAGQLDHLDAALGRLARAAHVVHSAGGAIAGPPSLADGLLALGGRLHQIDQPDIADRIQGFTVRDRAVEDAPDRLAIAGAERDDSKQGSETAIRSAARYVRAARAVVADDRGSEIHLLPNVPVSWRGRSIEVFGAPITNGTLSFGLRWHGPRPALLWEATLTPEAPITIRVPGIDDDFETSNREGEVLLADPGWATS